MQESHSGVSTAFQASDGPSHSTRSGGAPTLLEHAIIKKHEDTIRVLWK
jgi:hypothetical protein